MLRNQSLLVPLISQERFQLVLWFFESADWLFQGLITASVFIIWQTAVILISGRAFWLFQLPDRIGNKTVSDVINGLKVDFHFYPAGRVLEFWVVVWFKVGVLLCLYNLRIPLAIHRQDQPVLAVEQFPLGDLPPNYAYIFWLFL